MYRNLTALFLSLLIHALVVWLLLVQKLSDNLYKPPPTGSEKGERVRLKHLRFQPSKDNQAPNPSPDQNSHNVREQRVSEPLPLQAPIQTPIQAPMQTPKTQVKQQPQEKDSQSSISNADSNLPPVLQDFVLPDFSVLNTPAPALSIYDFPEETSQKIHELYGIEFGSLSPNAQQFLMSNLDKIGKITQSYLKYPAIAGRIGQEGDNVIEFYLHPNGDITELMLLRSSGYSLLDENSLHTIKIAYKDYPYPSEKTKIRIRVTYRIY